MSDSNATDPVALVERSGYFDWSYYRMQRDALASESNLLLHYLHTGWRDGLDPGPWFDTSYYVDANPDVRSSGLNPLVHYLLFGRDEGRSAVPPRAMPAGVRASASVPSADAWSALPARDAASAVVDVVVPVYRGYGETMRCLYSVLAAPVRTPFELVVVDDATPDARLRAALDELAAAGRIVLLRNERNCGFAVSANAGMRRARDRDVVLLNADTEVFGDWLDRLRHHASKRAVATVTPFSNNARICSYPVTMQNTLVHLEVSDGELDALAADVNRGASVDIPTAVGFCMYVRRDCIERIGYLDDVRFAAGYGEENDFSRRAVAAGLRNVLAADVFVRHYGSVSFGIATTVRERAALRTLVELYPLYSELVRRFVEDDPIAPLRRRIDLARLRRLQRGRVFLFVTHRRGGGTERHVRDLAARIRADGGSVVMCRADQPYGNVLRLDVERAFLPNLPTIEIPRDLDCFTEVLREAGVTDIHVHHVLDLPPDAADFIRVAADRTSIPYDVTVHDYLFICPRVTLIDASGAYCGEPAEAGCARCLTRAGSHFGAPPIWEWRDRYRRLLRHARRVFVPDADVAARMRRHMPDAAYALRPHPDDVEGAARAPSAPVARPAHERATRRIGVIGAIASHKGSRLLLSCARAARERGLALQFCVVGYTDIDPQLHDAGVEVLGAYDDAELDDRIAAASLDVAWFPSVWPETYCYTLSAAMRAGVFPVAFDMGAIASRMRAIGWGEILPRALLFNPGAVAEALASVQPAPRTAVAARTPGVANGSFIAQYYDAPLIDRREPFLRGVHFLEQRHPHDVVPAGVREPRDVVDR